MSVARLKVSGKWANNVRSLRKPVNSEQLRDFLTDPSFKAEDKAWDKCRESNLHLRNFTNAAGRSTADSYC